MPTVGYRPYVRGRRSAPVGGSLGVAYDSSAVAYFAAMTVQPDATRKSLLNSLIVGLKSDGVWTLLDYLAIVAAHDAQAGRINAVNPAQVATTAGTITFTTDRGYRGDGTTGYLETGIADNAAGNWTQDAATLFAWLNVEATGVSAGAILGLSAVLATRISGLVGTPTVARIHGATATTGVTANTLGLSSATRTDASTVKLYRSGALDQTNAATTSAAPVASTFEAGKNNASFGDGRTAAFGWGGLLDATKNLALYNRLNTYLTAVGGA